MSDPSREVILTNALVDVSIEGWRFLRAVEHATSGLDAEQHRRTVSRCNYFRKKLTDTLTCLDLWFVTLDGTKYESGVAASAIKAEDFLGAEDRVGDQTIEPIVMGASGVVRTGTVTLKREV